MGIAGKCVGDPQRIGKVSIGDTHITQEKSKPFISEGEFY